MEHRTAAGAVKILLTHVYCWPEVKRGGERYLHELASALTDAGHEVAILSTAPLPRSGRELGVPVRCLRRRRLAPARYGELSDEVAFGVQATAVALWRRPDVWHALGTADAAGAGLLGRSGLLRPVYTDLGLPERSYRHGRPDAALHESVVKWVDAYVCSSSAASWALQRDYGRRGFTVRAGVDTRAFTPGEGRSRFPTLLFSGAVDVRRKGVHLLTEAFAIVLESEPDATLVICGPGDPAAVVASAPPAIRSRIVVAGPQSPAEMIRWYREAWATVLPSTYEAFGLVLVESLACGTPVVALERSGGPAEIVQPGIGTLAAADASSLGGACLSALEMARHPSTAGACRDASAAYDWRSAVVPQFERIYAGDRPPAASGVQP